MAFFKKKWFVFAVLISLFFSGLNPAEAKKKKTPEPAPVEKAVLKVTSEPKGATVVIDRVIRGQTPISIEIEKGVHLIRVSLDENWSPFIQEKDITGDLEINAVLKPINEFSYQKGRVAFEKGDYPSARIHMNNAVGGGKVMADAYFYLALLDRIKGDNDGMVRNLKEYVALNPPSGDFYKTFGEICETPCNYGVCASHYMMGEYYRETYNWARAATSYKLAIPLRERFIDPNLEPSYDNIRKYRQLASKKPGDYKTQIQLAYLYELKGMLFQAMMSYRDGAMALYKSSPAFQDQLGRLIFPARP